MATNQDHVQVDITVANAGIVRDGFGMPLILSHGAPWPDRVRFFGDSSEAVTSGYATDSPEVISLDKFFSQTPKPPTVAIGRAIGSVTQRYQIGVASPVAGETYGVNVEGEGVVETECEYTALADIVFTAANAGDVMTKVAHGMLTGAGPFRVKNAGGALPTNLAVDTNYWIIKLTADTFQLAATLADAIAETEVVIGSDGTGVQTLSRATNDVIVAQLVQALNAVEDKNYTAVHTAGAGETDYIVVTATAPGDWVSLEVTNPDLLSIAQTHAAPTDFTLAADLAAIALASSAWYELHTLFNSKAYVKACAAWVAANRRTYVFDVNETDAITVVVGDGTDTGAELLELGYSAVMGSYHPRPAAMFSAGWMGRYLPTLPGQATAKFKTLEGVEPVDLTGTHKANLVARRMNSYETVYGRPITWEGTVFSTVYRFFDVRRNVDWLDDEMTKRIFGKFVGSDGIGFDDPGIQIIGGGTMESLALAVDQGVLSRDPAPVVEMPLESQISESDKADRVLSKIKWSGELRGFIHKAIPVKGTVTF